MTRTTALALPALALAGGLVLTACGGGSSDTTTTGSATGSSAGQHGGGHSTDGTSSTAQGNDSDLSFLTGMTPHHAQAVEMSEIVLSAGPPAEVAALATRIKAAQAPEIEQMEAMLDDLGHEGDAGGHGAGHGSSDGSGHSGMLSDGDLAALEGATGTQAARLYLEGMIAHHQGAIEASNAQIADGQYAPAIELAETIKRQQAAEVTEMRALLDAL